MSILADLQKWMQRAITQAGAAGAGDVILPSSLMSSDERLEIYARAYIARLVECLRAEYPMLCRALGQELFDEFAVDYLERFPPQSYTLAKLGADFSRYLSDTRPQQSDVTSWPEALIDLATLEWTTAEVFDGPGVEADEPIDAATLQNAAAGWDSLRLRLASCVRLLQLRFPVHKYYRQLRDQTAPSPPAAATTHLVVTRLNYTVRHHEVSAAQFALLQSIERSKTLAEAVVAAANWLDSDDLDQLAAMLHVWFAWFATERIISGVESSGPPHSAG